MAQLAHEALAALVVQHPGCNQAISQDTIGIQAPAAEKGINGPEVEVNEVSIAPLPQVCAYFYP